MTRDDLSFLLENAAGLVLLVIGLDWLPGLIDVWIGGVGPEDPSTREASLRALIPLAAGTFLLLRRKPPAAPAAVAASASAMTRVDWLWVGCKLVGTVALLYGLSTLTVSLAWLTTDFNDLGSIVMIGSIVSSAIYVAGGAWLLFGDRVWRLACREVPATP